MLFYLIAGSKPVSSECFDLSLLITLLRRDSNVRPPKNGFDVPPSKDDNSDGAQIATIKYYRNELAHVSEAQMDEHMFNEIWSNLENVGTKEIYFFITFVFFLFQDTSFSFCLPVVFYLICDFIVQLFLLKTGDDLENFTLLQQLNLFRYWRC